MTYASLNTCWLWHPQISCEQSCLKVILFLWMYGSQDAGETQFVIRARGGELREGEPWRRDRGTKSTSVAMPGHTNLLNRASSSLNTVPEFYPAPQAWTTRLTWGLALVFTSCGLREAIISKVHVPTVDLNSGFTWSAVVC